MEFAGFSGATFTNASNAGVVFTAFKPFAERLKTGDSANKIIGSLYKNLRGVDEAFIIAIPPPPVRGIGNSGGFKMQIMDQDNANMTRVLDVARRMMVAANQTPGLSGVFTTFSESTPEFYLDIDRDKAQYLNVPIPNIFDTLSTNLGISYVNDFNAFGRVYQVRAQADKQFRMEKDDMLDLKVRSATGALVPLGTLADIRDTSGPTLVQRYNMYVSVPLQGNAAPGVSTGEAIQKMEALAAKMLPPGRHSNGRTSPTRKRIRAAAPYGSSHCRLCSSSWRWQPSMKAGYFRWQSS